MSKPEPESRYLYWFDPQSFRDATGPLKAAGYRLSQTLLTPCQVLHARGNALVYAPPAVWSRVCVRQGSWYRDSARKGQTMLMSEQRLPEAFDRFLDSRMSVTDFAPGSLPTEAQLIEIVESAAYQRKKPKAWEGIGFKDAFMFKVLFSVTGFWGLGDNLKKFWLAQRANHANFLSRKVTTKLDGEEVPYSVTGNAGVCSSCVEFFNVVETDSRKLVAACPGAVTFGGAARNTYYDVRPVAPATGTNSSGLD
ncbi:MAG: hypothetical protein OEW11_02565 [Nitrospirota bacterium]|nr:hypothetical protein [Nitrospirota bacterium]